MNKNPKNTNMHTPNDKGQNAAPAPIEEHNEYEGGGEPAKDYSPDNMGEDIKSKYKTTQKKLDAFVASSMSVKEAYGKPLVL